MIVRPSFTIISICWKDPQHQVSTHIQNHSCIWKRNTNTNNLVTHTFLFVLSTLSSFSLKVKSHHRLNSPCSPCPPHRCRPLPKRLALCPPNMAANMATTTTTTTTMSTRRRRRSTSTNTNISTNTKAGTRRRTERETTPIPTATARPAAGRCARHLCLTKISGGEIGFQLFSSGLTGYILNMFNWFRYSLLSSIMIQQDNFL